MNKKYNLPGRKSIEMIEKIFDHIGRSHYVGMYGVCIDKGCGATIFDVDGNEYIDLFSGASVALLGYANMDIIERVKKQSEKIQHTCFPYSPGAPAVEFARAITATFPKKEKDEKIKALLGMSGSDSNDAAIKCARKFTGKRKIISFAGGWHGSTGFSYQANGFPSVMQGMNLPPGEFIHVPYPATADSSSEAIRLIKSECESGDVAAIIIETVQGDGGNLVPYKDSLEKIAKIIKENKALYIVDEVQSGNGRSGKYWEIEHFNVKPDLITSAKGVGAGYFPVSICMGREEMIDSLDKAQHVFTYTGNPIGCVAALQVVKTVNNPEFLSHVNKMSDIYKQELNKLVEKYEIVKEARGFGLHLGLEIQDEDMSYGGLLGFMCAQRGVYPGYFGANNEVLRIHPPLIISEREVRKSIEVIGECVDIINRKQVNEETMDNYKKYAVGLGNDR